MKNSNVIFSQLDQILAGRNSKISAILHGYRLDKGKIESTYKDDISTKKIAEIQAEARRKIEAADKEARTEAAENIEGLMELLAAYINEPPEADFINELRIFKDFEVPMTEGEINALAERADGNLVSMRCLQAVAKKSGYKLEFPGADSYLADLTEVETLFSCPSLYAPADYVSEAVECSPDKVFHGVNYGRPSAVDVITGQSRATAGSSKLLEMSNRWSAGVAYTLEDVDGAETVAKAGNSKIDVSLEEDTAAQAAKMGAQRAANDQTAAEILGKYAI